MVKEFAPPRKILKLKSTTTTICGLFSFSSLPGKGDQKKVVYFSPGQMATYVVAGLPTRMPSWSKSPFYTSKDAGSKDICTKDIFFSSLYSPKAKRETASLSFGSSFGFPRIAIAGAKPAFFSPQMREKVGGKNMFSLCLIQKWRMHSILWVHRIKRKAALSWQIFRWQETLWLVVASERNESKPKMDQGSLPAKTIGKGLKDGTRKVDRAPVLERGNIHEAPAKREGLPGRMPMGAGFFKKARANSETWDLGLVMNKGKLFELSPPAAYVVVGLIKLVKPRFPLPFTYVVENSRRHSISDLTKSTKLCFSCSRPIMPSFICLPSFSSE
ncbi:60S ribosomal protein L2, mitochondrial [Capsicum chinense]|nr:60S ribosomal protein L2, mitochondrial [Capsicum chinense]